MNKKEFAKPTALPHLPPLGVSNRLRQLFLIMFGLVFFVLTISTCFFNPHFSHPIGLLLLFTVLWAGVFALLARALCTQAQCLQRYEKRLLGLFWVVLVLVQLLFYYQLAVYPTRDFERVYTAAVNYTINGFIQDPYLDYFYKFPNNMPITIVLQFVFRLVYKFGFTNFYIIGCMLGALCVQCTYTFTYLCCKKLFGVSGGFLALFLLLLCLPLQCYIGVFYTDIFALPVAPAAFYFYLQQKQAKTRKRQLLWLACLCLIVALGTSLKYSAVIVLIAIGVDMLLHRRWQSCLAMAALFVLLFAGIRFGFNQYTYHHFLDKSEAADKATPFTAWIMMGLQGDGAHNAADNNLVWVLPTQAEKKAAAAAEIKSRLSSYTPASFTAFLWQKSLRSFGSGNFSYTTLVADSPRRQTVLVEGVSPSGRYFTVFDTLVQGYHVLMLAGAALAAAFAVRRRKYTVMVPCITLFGLFAFLLLWEAGERYLLHFYPMFTLTAVFAIKEIASRGFGKKTWGILRQYFGSFKNTK